MYFRRENLFSVPPVLPLRQPAAAARGRGDPAVRRGGRGAHPEVGPHGVPGGGEGVRHVVEPRLGVHSPHHVTPEVGNCGEWRLELRTKVRKDFTITEKAPICPKCESTTGHFPPFSVIVKSLRTFVSSSILHPIRQLRRGERGDHLLRGVEHESEGADHVLIHQKQAWDRLFLGRCLSPLHC